MSHVHNKSPTSLQHVNMSTINSILITYIINLPYIYNLLSPKHSTVTYVNTTI